MKRLKYAIIGGGMTGVALGRKLQQDGKEDFIIFEKEKEAGGLCRTKTVEGRVLDIGGGHFLYSKFEEVYDFVFSHMPKEEFNFYKRISKIKVGNEYIDYPIESNLWQLDIDSQVEYLISTIQAGEVVGNSEPKNYEEWIKWKLGRKIADNYMLPYNKKIWGVEPKEMDIDWLIKIPKIETKEVLKYCLERKMDESNYPSHPGFYYPKEGGFQRIFDSIYNKIKDKVTLGYNIVRIERVLEKWVINGEFECDFIINTAPWPTLINAFNLPEEIRDEFKKLKANSLVISLWEDKFKDDWHWLYDPDLKVEFHRKFYIDNFAASSRKGAIYTETNYKRWPGKNTRWVGMEGAPITEYINDTAYPIPVIGHASVIAKILSYFKDKKLLGLGRWGEWKYYNSDVCIKNALELGSKI